MAYDLMLQIGVGMDASPYTRTIESMKKQASGLGASLERSSFIPALGRITGKANEFQKSLEASNARVIAFGASAGSIFALRSAFMKLVESTTTVEKSLADINSLLGLGSRDLQAFSNNLFKIANQTGVSFNDASKAAAEFSRQGLGVEETLKRTTAALALSRLSGLGFEESVSSLTGALNSFTKEALDAEDVVNRLAAVDAKYAVSSGDLAKALSRVGASASDANVSFNQVIAAVTAAQQVTARGGSVIGNSFKTIFTRLQRPEVLTDLESAGVKVRDLQGKIMPLMDVLRSLSTTYDGLGSSQKSFVAETVGGVYQINILKAIMSDLGSSTSIFSGAMKVAENSVGSVEARLKVLNQTISSQLIRTNNDLTQSFSNLGEILAGGTIRSGLSSFQSMIQKISTLTDKNSKSEGTAGSQFEAIATQGIAKGMATIIGGPGIQFALFAVFKLFERLHKFVIDSAKDITGLDQKAKDSLAIQQAVSTVFSEQKNLIQQLLVGEKSINEVAKDTLNTFIRTNAEFKVRALYEKAVTGIVSSSVTSVKTAARGVVPNLNLTDPEQSAARKAGYYPGNTVMTQVRMGSKTLKVLANTKETKSTVIGNNGLEYDYIHPPQGTAAWENHRRSSLRVNGIDPSLLRRSPVAMGFVPNLVPIRIKDIRARHPQMGTDMSNPTFFNNLTIENIKALRDKSGRFYADSVKKGDTRYLRTYLDEVEMFDTELRSRLKYINAPVEKSKLLYRPEDVLAKGFVPNLVSVFRGIKSFMAEGVDLTTNNVFKPFRSLEDSSSNFRELLDKTFRSLHGSPEDLSFYLGQLAKKHQEDPTLTTMISSSYEEAQAAAFGDKIFKKSVPDKRILTSERIETLAKRFGINRVQKAIANASFVNNGRKGIPLDVNNLLKEKAPTTAFYNEYSNEKEVSFLAKGLVPNLGNFLSPSDIEPHVRNFFGQTQADALMKSANKKGLLPADSGDFRKWLGGVILAKTAFPGVTSSHADTLASLITKTDIAGRKKEEQMLSNTMLRPQDVQKVLSRYGEEFPLIAAYSSAVNPTTFKNYSYNKQYQAGEFNKFQIPVNVLSHSSGPELYKAVQDKLGDVGSLMGSSSKLSLPHATFGGGFGSIFDEILKNFFKERGVSVGGANSPIDILGYHPDIAQYIGTNKPFAGADAKASIGEGIESMPGKIFRILAGEAGGKLSGPSTMTPPLRGINKFNPKSGGIGIIDSDFFEKHQSKKTNEFLSFLYSAIATGKPLKTHFGPMGSGKTTAAQKMGGQFVSSLSELDSDAFKQFIFTTTASSSKSFNEGVFNLAFAASSDIESFMASPETLRARIAQRGRGKENAKAIITDQKMIEYATANAYLQKTFGHLGRFSTTSSAAGMIPNLTKIEGSYMGGGGSGNFYKLRDFKGLPIGVKRFHDTASLSDIEKEYRVSEVLQSKSLNPLFSVPKLIGNLTNSLSKKRIGKEIAEGTTWNSYRLKNGFSEYKNGFGDGKNQLGRAGDFLRIFQDLAYNQLKAQGIYAEDFVGHPSNTIVNPTAVEYLNKMAEYIHPYHELKARMKTKPGLVNQIATALARKGAKLSMIDVGEFEMAKEAMAAENSLTGGTARLAAHPLMVSSWNPGGLVAINQKQGTADKAIAEHLQYQSIGAIKKQRSSAATGMIPNLADTGMLGNNFGNSVILSIIGYFSQIGATKDVIKKYGDSFNFLLNAKDKELSKMKQIVDEYGRLRDALITQEKNVVSFSGSLDKKTTKKQYTSASDMEKDWGNSTNPAKNIIGKYSKIIEDVNKEKSEKRSRTSNLGWGAMWGASMIGGVASEAAGRFSPTWGAAIDKFTSNVTNAGQALIAFPNVVGKTFAAGLIGAGVGQALDSIAKGLESSRAAYERETSLSQKYTSQLDLATRSLSEYDGLLGDASASLRSINKEASKYFNILAQMSSSSTGNVNDKKRQELVEQIKTAPDNRSRIRLLQEARGLEENRMQQLSAKQLLRELVTSRSMMNPYNGKIIGSSGTFSYSSPLEKDAARQNVLSLAGAAVDSLSESFKQSLMDSVNNLNSFNKAIEKGGDTLLKEMIDNAGTEKDKKILTQSVRNILAEQKLDTHPDLIKIREWKTDKDTVRQQSLDLAIQKEQTLRRLFLNQGSLMSQNALNVRGLSGKREMGRFNTSMAFEEGMMSSLEQQYGERTIKSLKTSMDLKKIEMESTSKEKEIKNSLQGSLTSHYSQNFDSIAKNLTQFQGISNQGFVSKIGENSQAVISGINRGLTTVLGKGDISKFQGPKGFNFEALETAIAQASNTQPNVENQIKKYLENNRSTEVLKMIENYSVQIANNTQETVDKTTQSVAALQSFKEGLNFKQLSSFMGGIKNLMDRTSNRTFQRDLMRGGFLLERGRTAEQKGMGANLLLNSFKEQNIPINTSGNSPLSKLMAKAWDAGIKGLASNQERAFAAVYGGLQKGGASKTVLEGFKGYKPSSFMASAEAAMKASYLPENSKLIDSVSVQTSISLNKFDKALTMSIDNVKSFGGSFVTTIAQLNQAVSNIQTIRIINDREQSDDAKDVKKIQEGLRKGQKGATKQPELDQKNNWWGGASQGIGMGIGALGYAVYGYGAYRLGKGRAAAPAKMTAAELSDISSKTVRANVPWVMGTPSSESPIIGPKRPLPGQAYNWTKETPSLPTAPVSPSLPQAKGPLVMGEYFGKKGTPLVTATPTVKKSLGQYFGKFAKGAGGRIGIPLALMAGMTALQAGENGESNVPSSGHNFGNMLQTGANLSWFGGLPSAAVGNTASLLYGSGQSIYKSRMDNVNLDSRSQQVQNYAISRLSKGDSVDKVRTYLNKLIQTNEQSKTTLGGFFSQASSPTAQNQIGSLEQANVNLKAIREGLGAMKESIDAQKNAQAAANEFLQSAMKGGEGEGGTVNSNIKVEISLKDGGKIPDLIMKDIIEPIKAKLAELQSQVINLQQYNNIPVAPSTIG